MQIPQLINEIYANYGVPLYVHDVHCPELIDFERVFSVLRGKVKETQDQDFLKEFRHFIFSVIYTFKNSPAPYSILARGDLRMRRIDLFEKAEKSAETLGVDMLDIVKEARVKLEKLLYLPNPLMECFNEVFGEGNLPDRSFVVQRNWMPGVQIQQLRSLTNIELETPLFLDSIEAKGCYFGQISVYQYRLYESFLLAPSFREIHLIGFNSERSILSFLNCVSIDFLGGRQNSFQPVKIQVVKHDKFEKKQDKDKEKEESLESAQIRRGIIERFLHQLDASEIKPDYPDQEVTASALMVSGGEIIFLRQNGRPKVLIPGDTFTIASKPVLELEHGDIILQRSESANVKSEYCEELHDEWKMHLANCIDLGLIDELRLFLKSRGFKQTPVTIRNWCEKLHGPADKAVFAELMDFLDLDRVDERWAIIQSFRELGHEAGAKASDQLSKEFLKLTQTDLVGIRDGRIIKKTLNGSDSSAGSMYAVMIEGVFVRSLTVKQHLLGKVIPISEDLLWH